jgi:hypothetical protein
MPDTELAEPIHQELAQLHAATCMLMTQFINGRHCLKLARLIVQQLACLLSHPELMEIPASRNMYQQLMEHWQQVVGQLLEQRTVRQRQRHYH